MCSGGSWNYRLNECEWIPDFDFGLHMLKDVSSGYLLWYSHSKTFYQQTFAPFTMPFWMTNLSPIFLCVELLGYGCFFTTLNTGISKLRCRQVRTAAKFTPETCQMHSKQGNHTVTSKGHQNTELPSKSFSSSGIFKALSSELLFILKSK